MKTLVAVLAVIQLSCFVVGIVQGVRYIKTNPFAKGAPWMATVILIAFLVMLLTDAK